MDFIGVNPVVKTVLSLPPMTMFELVETGISYHKRSYGFGTIVGVTATFKIRECIMEPVVGLDVAKGASVVQAFLRRNEPYGLLESITHEESGFERLGELLDELKVLSGREPVIILEATGHYHRGLVSYLIRGEYKHFIINPLQSKRARNCEK